MALEGCAHRPHTALATVELDINILRIVWEGRGLPATGQHCGNSNDVVDVLHGMCGVLAGDADGFKCKLSALALGVGSGGNYGVRVAGGGGHAGCDCAKPEA